MPRQLIFARASSHERLDSTHEEAETRPRSREGPVRHQKDPEVRPPGGQASRPEHGEVANVLGDDDPPFGSRDREDFDVPTASQLRALGHANDIVATTPKGIRDLR